MLDEYLKTIEDERRKKFIERAIAMGVSVQLLSREFRILGLVYKNTKRFLYRESFYINKKPGTLFSRNKEVTKILLRKERIKAPTGTTARNYDEALRAIEKHGISFPVVIKPIDAGKGLGVSVEVTNRQQLKKAIKNIKEFQWEQARLTRSGIFVVEEMKRGKDFRVLVLGNRAIACVERIPAHVIGDGKSTIRELIATWNKGRPPGYILKVDNEVRYVIHHSNLRLDSIIPSGVKVVLRKNANISAGGKAIDRTSKISQRFKYISVRSAKALQLTYAGIDIITSDISSENSRQDYSVIEVNGAPDYDIHEKPIVHGKGVDVTSLLITYLMRIT